MSNAETRKAKLKRVLKQDLRVTEDRGWGFHLVEQEAPHVEQMCIAVPDCFQDGDKVRVTVELIERRGK